MSMTVVEIIAMLADKGVRLAVADGQLKVSAPKGAITAADKELLVANKAAIIDLLSSTQSEAPAGIPVADRSGKLPLSFGQERLWFLDELEPGSSLYNIPTAIKLTGDLNVDALRQAFLKLIARHESLRTTFGSANDEPLRATADVLTPDIDYRDADTSLPLEAQLTQLSQQPFDLAKGPLIRLHLLKIDDQSIDEQSHALLIVVHHIIADGWALGVLMRDLSELYKAAVEGTAPQLPELQIQDADYAAWQRDTLSGDHLNNELQFWKDELQGAPLVLELPTDRPRPASPAYSGDWFRLDIDADTRSALEAVAREHGATLYMVLLSAFNLLLSRYSGAEELLVGSPVANREQKETENLIGSLINTVAIRADLSGNPPFTELLGKTRDTALNAFEHQALPFEKLVEELQPERNLSHSPVYQVMFNLQNRAQEVVEFADLESSALITETGTAKLDLHLLMEETDNGLSAWFEYATELFDRNSIERMAGHYARILKQVAANPQQQINNIRLPDEAETQLILNDWNNTARDYPADVTLIDLFETQVAKTPDAVAVVFEGQELSYRELDERANHLGHELQSHGIGPESVVGVYMERSIEMVVALYGILKAGAAYTPLDPEYPAQRLQHMLEDAGTSVVVTQTGKQPDNFSGTCVELDSNGTSNSPFSSDKPETELKPDNLAYVIFTSGSTGRPKGVMNEHRGIVNRLLWMQDEYQLTDADSVLQKTAFSFDVSVWEFFWPLITGARLVVARPAGHKDPAYLIEAIEEHGITTMHFVPSMLQTFLLETTEGRCSSLRQVMCSGEALPWELTQDFFSKVDSDLHNLYGPTEAAIDVTYWACPAENPARRVPIGRPVANTQIYIVDASDQLAPVGVPGELLIGGVQVARGYMNRDELTAEKFIADPFVENNRAYRTGDLARYLPDGTVEYLGRIDAQIKLRGFRIELGEIDAALAALDAVEFSATVVKKNAAGSEQLVSYIVSNRDDADTETLRDSLRTELPDYMVPAFIILIDELPLTPNGKLDRKALPEPEWSVTTEYVAPRNDTETQLATIWAEALGAERVGIYDDFFALGGHSLLAARTVARIRRELNADVALKLLFDCPTIASFAAALDTQGSADSSIQPAAISRDDELPLSFAQQRLWFLNRMTPDSSLFNIPWAIRLKGALNTDALQTAVSELTQRHETLRTTFTELNGQPVQQVHASADVPVQFARAADDTLIRDITALAQQPFDLDDANQPLFRVHLLTLDDTDQVLLFVIHHVIADGWSLNLMFRDLMELYRATCENDAAQLPELPLQYADFADWQRRYLEDQQNEQLGYWKQHLNGAPSLLELPTDHPRPAVQTYRGGVVSTELPAELHSKLSALSGEQGTTLFTTLLTAFYVLMQRYSGQDDIVIGTPVAGRARSEFDDVLGCFLNNLVLRADLSGNPAFSELLTRIKDIAVEGFAHQDLPFEKLVEELQPARDMSHSPLFQVMFTLQTLPEYNDLHGGLTANSINFDYGTAKYDLSWWLMETPSGLTLGCEYAADLFEANTIERMLGHYRVLLESVLEHPQAGIDSLGLLSAQELTQFDNWNSTAADYPADKGLHQLFEEQAARTPDAIAVEFSGEFGDEKLTYAELNAQANALAQELIELGAGPDERVAICVNRNLHTLTGLLGILKSGAGYVPLDPIYPPERIGYMLEDSGAKLLVSEPALSPDLFESLPTDGLSVIDINDARTPVDVNPDVRFTPDQLAYLIYTSGSTGLPKGVELEHRGVVNFLHSMAATPGINADDKLLAVTTLCFDISVLELFLPVLNGATVVIATHEQTTDGKALSTLLDTHSITQMQATPATWRLMQQAGWQGSNSLKVLVGGEALERELAEQLHAHNDAVWNMYGPTETTIWSACHRFDPDAACISVGKPIANTQFYVLDSQLQLTPAGVPGELWIGGDGVARGYWQREELTAERFIDNPFSTGRIYCTGDRVRWLNDGTLEVLGRTDYQVKLRGFRIELGEIESRLGELAEITQSVVVLREDTPGDRRLVAYSICPEGVTADPETLREHLAATLPDYMVPSAFVQLERYPLTPNGKIDRKAFPAPGLDALVTTEYTAPRNETEQALCALFADTLGIDADGIGIHDDFFNLGGHSLIATGLLARIRDSLNADIPLFRLFADPTVAGLAALIDADSDEEAADSIPVADRNGELPPSSAQTRVWFLDELEPGSAAYNMPWAMKLHGTLNVSALQTALNELISRHESLRTTFPAVDGEPQQVIHESLPVTIVKEQLPPSATDAEINERLQYLAAQPFDLHNGPLLRADLLKVSDEEHVLLICLHHIIYDAWSHQVLLNELNTLYIAQIDQTEAVLPALPLQYADYAAWEQNRSDSDEVKAQLGYWKQQLADIPAALELPTDYPRPAVQQPDGARFFHPLPDDLLGRLNQLAGEESGTLFMVLLSAFDVLLSKYANQQDIVVSTPVSGRDRSELQGIIGFFLNTLALRADVDESLSFRGLLTQVRNTTLNAFEHQDIPFERLVEELEPVRDTSRAPIAQVQFVLQHVDDVVDVFGDMHADRVGIDTGTTKFDLTLFVSEVKGTLAIDFEYNTSLFRRDTIARMAHHFDNLLHAVVNAPDTALSAVSLLGDAERQQVLYGFNNTAADFGILSPVHQLVEQQAERTPDAIAVEGLDRSLSYAELNSQANRLAHALVEKGADRDELVAISCERSVDMAVATLAVLKTGAAYVPVDPAYPAERIAYMLEDAGASLLLTHSALNLETAATAIELDQFDFGSGNDANPSTGFAADDAVYAIYTSGSTGLPKGVRLTHGGLSNLIHWQQKQGSLSEPARTLQFASLSFDVSFQELYTTWAQGGTLVMIDEELRKDLPALADFISERSIERLYMPYAALQPLADILSSRADLPLALRDVISAGEQLQVTDGIRALFAHLNDRGGARLHNQYGPSETHVVTALTLPGKPERWPLLPNIGTPVANTRCYILDSAGNPTPVGVPGELWLAGTQVSPGYLNRPRLTAEKMLPDPFYPEERAYRSGDRARYKPNGQIEYLGRIDEQVKFRGFRIEPGEIEAALTEHPSVQLAAVVLLGQTNDKGSEQKLVAYATGDKPDATELRGYLNARLPDYMVPTHFVVMETMPLTPSGKVARRLLPEPEWERSDEQQYVAPSTAIETTLADIWSEVLGVPQIGIHDDFFELGGHSLLATKVVSRIRDALNTALPLMTLFSKPTIAELAMELGDTEERDTSDTGKIEKQARGATIPLSFAQQRLWFIDQLDPGNPVYNLPWPLRLKGKLDKAALGKALNELTARHESLRTVFRAEAGKPVQVIRDSLTVELPEENLSGYESALITHIQNAAGHRFDLSEGPLLTAELIALNEDDHVLLIVMHHIIADMWSGDVILSELSALYNALSKQSDAELPSLGIQYADYAIWEQSGEHNERLERQLHYWQDQLAALPPLLELPTDRPRPPVQTFNGGSVNSVINTTLTGQLKQLSADNGCTLFMTLLGAFQVLLYRYSGQPDIPVGTPIAGRRYTGLEELVGVFVNTLVMRGDLAEQQSFSEYLQQVKATALEAYDNQDIPFEKLVEEIQPERNQSYTPLFQVLISLQTPPPHNDLFDGLSMESVDFGYADAKFDLALVLTEWNGELQIRFDYNRDLFDASTVEAMTGHFGNLLAAAVSDPQQSVAALPMLGADELQTLIYDWNDNGFDYPAGQTMHGLFEARAALQPDAIALRWNGEDLSYGELNRRANRLARHLQTLGVGSETLVAVCTERRTEMIIGMYAIQKAGGAYVPVDPNYPPHRVEFMLQDSEAPVVLTSTKQIDNLPESKATPISLDSFDWGSPEDQDPNIGFECAEDQLGYVIYTSGSTGVPKGVEIEHRNAVALINWAGEVFAPEELNGVVASTSICFDLSVFEIFMPLAHGGRIVLVDDALALTTLEAEANVVLINTVPSAIAELVRMNALPPSIKTVNLAGEPLSTELVNDIYAVGTVERVNDLYGPSEDTTYSTWTRRLANVPPSIGRPIYNTQAYLLDQNQQPVPKGVPGELYLGGAGVTRGYRNRPELTAEKYLADPFRQDDLPGNRVYRTGDLVRYREDGSLEFIGRVDHQIKLRGFRIELGEIESELKKLPGIDNAVVIVHGEDIADKKLVGYVEVTSGDPVDSRALKEALKEELPGYMVPQIIMVLSEFPLTPNGKINRAALPEPETDLSDSGYVAPRTPVEEIVCDIIAGLLKLPRVGINDDFFELGGHSLLAAQLVARLRDALDVDVQLRDLFDAPTAADIARVADKLEGREAPAPIKPADRSQPLPLSFAQQRLWFLEQLEPGNPVYNLPWAMRLTGELDVEAFKAALNALAARHETMRTCFASHDGVSVQVIADSLQIELDVQDIGDKSNKELRRIVSKLGQQAFDLTTAPLFRAHLLKLKDDEHMFVMNMHHIISDGWSLHVVFRELIALYEAAHNGEGSEDANLPSLQVQYADYAAWQRDWLATDDLLKQLDYWREQLRAAPTLLELPTDHPRTAVQTFEGRHLMGQLSPALTAKLKQLAADNGSTLFMVLLAAFNVLLARYSNQHDILVGTPVAGRKRTELEQLIGFFVNTLVLRTDMTDNPAFTGLLQQVKKTTLDAFDNQELPFEKLVDEVQPTRDMSHSPLFQVMFVMQNQPWTGERFEQIEASNFELDYGTAKFDLTVSVQEDANGEETGLSTYFEYNTALFEEVTVRQMRSHFEQLLESIVATPDAPVAALPLLQDVELDIQFEEWNPEKTRYRDDATIHELFNERVEAAPDGVAVSFGDQRVSYADLNGRANQIAHHLIAQGVGKDVLVGICLERSVDMVASILAVFKAGGAYVPLDPDYPAERIAYMLGDSQAQVIITTSKIAERLPEHNAKLLPLDTSEGVISREPRSNPDERAEPQQLAYVIYTSGSTGNPKGVMLRHQGVCNLMRAQQRVFHLNDSDRMLQFASISFDASIFELVMGLGVGAEMVLATKEDLTPGEPLLNLLRDRRVTAVTLPPSALMQMQPRDLPDLRVITVAGEACPQELVDRWSSETCKFFNLYGPTETTVWATYEECQPGRTPTIGKAIPNAEVYILNEADQPVPVGVAGELCLGGAGLALGYLNRPELTAEKFIEHPCKPGTRIYRTGDLVRFNREGDLEFLGRIDHQVKVRGFRIELGEIENALADHAKVREAVVLAKGDNLSDRQLAAYLVSESGEQKPTLNELRNWLQQTLPDFMVPASFVVLDEFPLTPNGKVDRKALPELDSGKLQIESEYIAPRNPVEEKLANIWASLLGIERVGIHDNFFELGGDSILSIQIIARAARENIQLAPRQVFQHQTIAELAAAAGQDLPEISAEQGRVLGNPVLTPIQRWFFDKDFKKPEHFNQSMLLETGEPLNAVILEQAMHLLTDQHDALRMRYENNGGEWTQSIAPFEDGQLVTEVNSRVSDTTLDRIQTRLKIGSGPLLKAALLNDSSGKPQRLLLVVNHLAIDWVSWPVLLADLEAAYQQLSLGKPVSFPRKTTSFREWSERLLDYAGSEELQQELSYWESLPWSSAAKLPVDHADGHNVNKNIEKHSAHTSIELSKDTTAQLLQEVASRYRARPNELLLAAVSAAVAEWTGERNVIIDLEGHGREDLFEDVDLSRTVGWFTTLYPLLLQLPESGIIGTLHSVREQLQAIPGKGLGFGVLRWLGGKLTDVPAGEIGFNYLGQVEQAASQEGLFTPANGYRGKENSPENPRTHLVDINSLLSDDQLYINIGYSNAIFDDSSIERFTRLIHEHLETLANSLSADASGPLLPGDFPLAQLDQTALDTLLTARADIEDVYPLTPLQQGMLFHSLLGRDAATADTHKDVYFASFNWDLEGEIDTALFEQAWNHTLNQHSSLRTAVHWNNLKDPLQVVYRNVAVPFTLEDLRHLGDAEKNTHLNTLIDNDRSRAFDLNNAPLTRVTLVRLGDTHWRLIWSFHHMVMDGWSVPLVIRQMFEVYESLHSGEQPKLKQTRPFSDYIEWLQTQDENAAETFWRANLKGFVAPTPLPGATAVDAAQAQVEAQAPEYRETVVQLPAEFGNTLREFAKQHRLTVNSITQGAWALLLARYSGEEDVAFGATTAGRPATLDGIESMIGLFLNTLPVRIVMNDDAPLSDWLQEIQTRQLDMQQYEYASLVDVQGWSDVPRGKPLFETLLAFENYPDIQTMGSGADEAGSIRINSSQGYDRTNFPLTLNVAMMDTLYLRFIYDSTLFSDSTMQRIASHLQNLLQNMPARASDRVADVPMLSAAESTQLERWNDTGKPYPADATLPGLLYAQAEKTPDAPAIRFGDEQLTYAQLDARSNRLAHYLAARGIGAESLVGVCMDRSIDLVVVLHAIVKAGGAYVPMDPEYPEQRLQHMAEDAQLTMLISQQHLSEVLPGVARITIEAIEDELNSYPAVRPSAQIAPDQAAYVIFTSGSTGRPKGVLNEHRGICNRLLWMQDEYQLDGSDRVLQKTPFSFDVSVWEFFWPFISGAELVVAKPGGHRDSHYLAGLIKDTGVTTLHFVPSMLQVFLQDDASHGCNSLKRVICSGEALPVELQNRFFAIYEATELHNLYGPTEAAIDVSYWACRRGSTERSVPIGRPVANTKLYVVDAAGHRTPVGVPGELWISGVQVARGYVNRPELTAERFIDDPFNAGARVYRTGDLVRHRDYGTEGGAIEFLGRIDHQVKLRGFRIELGEIEAVIDAQDGVTQSVVMLREDVPGLQQLVAYVVSDAFDEAALSAAINDQLPDYMLPSAWVAIDKIPLSPNGKVERRALPAPDVQISQVEYEAPRDEFETALTKIWTELLGVERVGIRDDFFALGGHSLIAMRTVTRIRDQLNIDVPLDVLFSTPTIAQLAETVNNARDNDGETQQISPAEPAIRKVDRSSRRTRRRKPGNESNDKDNK